MHELCALPARAEAGAQRKCALSSMYALHVRVTGVLHCCNALAARAAHGEMASVEMLHCGRCCSRTQSVRCCTLSQSSVSRACIVWYQQQGTGIDNREGRHLAGQVYDRMRSDALQ
jgi:hypothetical protein